MKERPTRLRAIRSTVPPAVEAAVARGLEKTPADRFPSAAAFAAALTGYAPVHTREATSRPTRAVLIALAAALVIGAVAYLMLRPATLAVAIGRSEQITAEPGLEIQPALSPDGQLVAYAAGTAGHMRIFIRPVTSGGGRTIPLSDDSTAVETHPRWSPDGSQLLFLTRGGAATASAFGGSSRPVVPPSAVGDSHVQSAIWSPDGREIGFVRSDTLLIVPSDGGTPRPIAGGEDLHSCDWAPHGKWIVCASQNSVSTLPGTTFGNLAPSSILLFPVHGGGPIRVAEPPWSNQSPVFAPDGVRLFFLSNRDGPRDVYVVTLSSSGKPRGTPQRLSTGLGATSISLSADGRRLAYAAYNARSNVWSLPIPQGAEGPVTTAGATPVTRGNQVIESMRVSHDGRWLVYDSDVLGNANIYRMPLGGGAPEQLTTNTAEEFAPDLSPDGRYVAYHSWRTGTRDIEVKPLDGGPVQQVTNTPGQEGYPVWSPDGEALAFVDTDRPVRAFVTRRGLDGSWSAPVLLADPGLDPEWSPDGRWISYVMTGDFALSGPLMIMPATGGQARAIMTPGNGIPAAGFARWSPDGRTLYYKAHGVRGGASFWSVSAQGGRPRLLVRFDDPAWQSSRNDFTTDGKRLYFAVEDRQSDVFVADLIKR
jgi:Tol biopolymer transport system component